MSSLKKISRLAYDRADAVTALYGHARKLQTELGCDISITHVTPNGIDVDSFANIPGKQPEDEGFINIGAVLRVTPIKDVKTMIRAFAFAAERVPNLKLWIMGPRDEDKEYAEECYELVEVLGLENVIFTGRIQVKEYLGRMDFTILTSISEGQPLTILESFAAHKPVIATDVGNCRELIYGEEGDTFGNRRNPDTHYEHGGTFRSHDKISPFSTAPAGNGRSRLPKGTYLLPDGTDAGKI